MNKKQVEKHSLNVLWIPATQENLPKESCYCLVVWEFDGIAAIGEAHWWSGSIGGSGATWLFPVYGDDKDSINKYPTVTHYFPLDDIELPRGKEC